MTGTPDPGDVREATRLFHGSLVVLPILTSGFLLGTEMRVQDALFVSVLLGTLPLLSLAQLPLLHHSELERLPAYLGSTVTLLGLGSLALVLGWLGPGLEPMGLAPTFGMDTLRETGILLAGVGALALAFHLAGRMLDLEESELLKALIPRTPRERWLFALLSLAAGVGEEIVYRGYLIVVLSGVFSGPWSAALVSSLAFALLHAYQGNVGIIRSGLLGFVFAAAFIVTGSLWPLIVVHAGVDLISGLALGPRMLNQDANA